MRKTLAVLTLAGFVGACGPASGPGGFGGGSDPNSKGPSMNGAAGGGGSGSGGGAGGAGSGSGGSGSGGVGGSGGGGGSGSGGALVVAGAYDVTTQFNLLDALPPDVKEAFSLAIEFADSPGNFLLDMADKLPVIKYVVDALNL